MRTTEQKQVEINRHSLAYKLHRLFLPSTHRRRRHVIVGGKTNTSYIRCLFPGRAFYYTVCNAPLSCVLSFVACPVSSFCPYIFDCSFALHMYVLYDILYKVYVQAQGVVPRNYRTIPFQYTLCIVRLPAS